MPCSSRATEPATYHPQLYQGTTAPATNTPKTIEPTPDPSIVVIQPLLDFTYQRIARTILLSTGPMISMTRAKKHYLRQHQSLPTSIQIMHVMNQLQAEEYGTVKYDMPHLPTDKTNVAMFHKKPPAELWFPIEQYGVDEEEYLNNFKKMPVIIT